MSTNRQAGGAATDRPAPPARGHRPRGLPRLCWVETVLFLREPAAMFFVIVLPLALLLFTGLAYGDARSGDVRAIDQNVPQIITVIVLNLGVPGLAISIAEYRDRGILRRYRLAPVPFWWFWLSQAFVAVLMFLVSTALLLGVVAATYGVLLAAPWDFALVSSIGLAFTFSLGVLLGSARVPLRTVQVIGTGLFFVLFLGSGAAVPRTSFPHWLRDVTALNPMTPVVDAATSAYVGDPLSPHLPGLGLVVVCTVVLAVCAVRMSSWEADR